MKHLYAGVTKIKPSYAGVTKVGHSHARMQVRLLIKAESQDARYIIYKDYHVVKGKEIVVKDKTFS